MKKADLLAEILGLYKKHGWRLRKMLLTAGTMKELGDMQPAVAEIKESSFDGLWFSRPSHEGREAWELRLLEQTPYALFENFEPDETEEQRDEVRLEMEARLREHVIGS